MTATRVVSKLDLSTGAAVNYAISTGQNVVYIAATNARLFPFSVAVTGVDAATVGELKVFAVGLFECLTKCSDLRAMLSFQLAFSAVSAATMLLSVRRRWRSDLVAVGAVAAGARCVLGVECCCRGTRGRHRLPVGRLGMSPARGV